MVYKENPGGRRSTNTDNMIEDLKEMEIKTWRRKAQGTKKVPKIVQQATIMSGGGLVKEFLIENST